VWVVKQVPDSQILDARLNYASLREF
jgi:hypothetical protein